MLELTATPCIHLHVSPVFSDDTGEKYQMYCALRNRILTNFECTSCPHYDVSAVIVRHVPY